jgi:myo-inositol 2-dehydrogenase / D-chiro-inositol 1-dehydrogenase
MNNDKNDLISTTPVNRRQFLATSTRVVAGAALVAALPRAGYTAENNTIKIALIGCGGRGSGAVVQALSTKGPVKLWAMADFFENHLQSSLAEVKKQRPDQVDVPPERQFVGLGAFKKAMGTLDKGDLVLLATPPAFRSIHVEHAISKDLHVFMEKSFAVDAPGIRRILNCGEEAKRKNLKIAGGLMERHSVPLEEAVQKIHHGTIGNVITGWAYREHGPVGMHKREPAWSELAYQIANFAGFTWLNGSFFVDWLIHNIDVACWIKNDWPVTVQGMGGRQVRQERDQLFDHYAAEYTFADGTRMVVQGRHMEGCWDSWGVQAQGAKGSAVLGEGVDLPRLYKGYSQTSKKLIWHFKGQKNNPYQTEHDLLFEAIRNNKPYNETERCAKSNLTAIMGRMACESGQKITWNEAMNSNLELAPGLDTMTEESNPPVMPDEDGHYPIAIPGQMKVK